MRKPVLSPIVIGSALASYGINPRTSRVRLDKPNTLKRAIDIHEEYELIKLKKSKLSANERRWVVAKWERENASEK